MNRDHVQWINSTLKELDNASGLLSPKNQGCAIALTAIGHAADCLKSLREHIKDKEREAGIAAMMVAAGVSESAFNDDPEARAWAESLYDAGYRKAGDQ